MITELQKLIYKEKINANTDKYKNRTRKKKIN